MNALTQLVSLVPGVRTETTAANAADVDGYFPADSMIRRLHGERLVAFSGIRALLMQACDPLAVVGFRRHSVIYSDPQTRLRRTDDRMSRIYFGTREHAEDTGRKVREMHASVNGTTASDYGPIPGGTAYAASDPKLGLWVLATLADSALVYYERIFGGLREHERESYWQDFRRVGGLLGLPDESMPASEPELRDYVATRLRDGSLWISDDQRDLAVAIVLEPPFTGWLRAALTPVSAVVKLTSVGLLPGEIRDLYGFSWDPAREALLRSTLLQLRAAATLWPQQIRLHPAATAGADELYGATATSADDPKTELGA